MGVPELEPEGFPAGDPMGVPVGVPAGVPAGEPMGVPAGVPAYSGDAGAPSFPLELSFQPSSDMLMNDDTKELTLIDENQNLTN